MPQKRPNPWLEWGRTGRPLGLGGGQRRSDARFWLTKPQSELHRQPREESEAQALIWRCGERTELPAPARRGPGRPWWCVVPGLLYAAEDIWERETQFKRVHLLSGP